VVVDGVGLGLTRLRLSPWLVARWAVVVAPLTAGDAALDGGGTHNWPSGPSQDLWDLWVIRGCEVLRSWNPSATMPSSLLEAMLDLGRWLRI
jgi:hypothetical protein